MILFGSLGTGHLTEDGLALFMTLTMAGGAIVPGAVLWSQRQT